MATTILTPAPTYAEPVVVNEQTGKSQFNPIWLKWFLDLSQNLQTQNTHNNLLGLQGGIAGEYYHMTAAEYTSLLAFDFGVFSETASQTQTVINTAKGVVFDTTGVANGVAIGTPASQITFTTNRDYKVSFSAQVAKSGVGTGYLWIWLNNNGTDVPNSAAKYMLNATDNEIRISYDFELNIVNGNYLTVMWAVSDLSITLAGTAAAGILPAIPSAVLSISQVNV